MPPRRAEDGELLLCHSREHLAALEAAAAAAGAAGTRLFMPPGGCFVSGLPVEDQLLSEEVAEFTSVRGTETYVTEGSMEQARAAVGGLLALVDAALDPCDPLLRGMALCRPPGHHAGRERSEGFCLLNGVAVAAAYARARAARDVERVLIFDWDVHHGNGTQELFWTDPSVLFVSAHRQDEGFFPGSGGSEEVGEGRGAGFTINVPLPVGYGDAALWAVCTEVLLPAARRFLPDLILVSAGFDAAKGDPIGGASVSPRLFGAVCLELRRLAAELCHGRLLLALEGGYAAAPLREAVGEVVAALASECREAPAFDQRPAWVGPLPPRSRAAISAAVAAHEGLPPGLLKAGEPLPTRRDRRRLRQGETPRSPARRWQPTQADRAPGLAPPHGQGSAPLANATPLSRSVRRRLRCKQSTDDEIWGPPPSVAPAVAVVAGGHD